MGDVKSNTGVQENPELDTSNDSMEGTANKMIAPTLRVEELRDEALNSSYTSEEEGVLSHGEGSDGGDAKANLPPMVTPNDELKQKIIKQVEFYFSDPNILKDAFLLKHVRRNKQGYVSLKLITSFRKVKSLSKDFRVVAYSLRDSQELEVNEEGTKVKRKAPLPDYDETTPSRTVVAVNLPDANPSIASVDEVFSKCGPIALIRILKSGKSIPPDVKKHLNKHPELNTSTCAVVEFESHEAAQMACKTLSNEDDWRKGMHVTLLAPQKKEKKNDKKKDKTEKEGGASGESPDQAKQGETGAADGEKKRRDRRKKKDKRFDELQDQRRSSGSEAEREPHHPNKADDINIKDNLKAGGFRNTSLSPKQDLSRLSPSNTPRSSPRNTPKSSPRSSPRGSPNIGRKKFHGKSPLAVDGESPRPSPRGSPDLARRKSSGGAASLDVSVSPSGSPWVQRRLKAQQESASPLAGTSPVASPSLGRRMEGIVRHPRGPDGTTGFYGGKGRGCPPLKG